MLKLLILAAVFYYVTYKFTGRWPHEWLGLYSKAQTAEAQARRLLGVSKTASEADIIRAHKRLLAAVHPDRGGTNDDVFAANAARDLLIAKIHRKGSGPL